ncbi:hypothetical protein Pla175_50120 [Pirellulimonas nuda]|uniref:Uncharacterized protein n=1 Tax=Pirellulimonas nuda TaxID=2528009 RepID=A0A518DJG6_9BACT|nr:hypothetical protein [Pirellulimonas nuda]QDU91582.1 hypothetical protein Pla175_50120 [Pirellulimonas nuda]
MKIARFWVRESATSTGGKGRVEQATGWGWSETNEHEARERARSAAQRIADWLAKGKREEAPGGEYAYLTRPAREEIVQELGDDDHPAAVVTRNRYGALVLNTRELMFIDADVPKPPPQPVAAALLGAVRRLFGGAANQPPAADPAELVLDGIRAWSAANPSVALTVYRTAAGFRCVVTNQAISARSELSESILAGLDSDPLYRRLCKSQECFRARLTPKPWRVGLGQPRREFPFEDAAHEAEHRDWVHGYDAACEGFAACARVERLGPEETISALAPLVELHDRMTLCDSGLPLA